MADKFKPVPEEMAGMEQELTEQEFQKLERRHQRVALTALFERLALSSRHSELTGNLKADFNVLLGSMSKIYGEKIGVLRHKIFADREFLTRMYHVYLALLKEKESIDKVASDVFHDHFREIRHPPTPHEWGKKVFDLCTGSENKGGATLEFKEGFAVFALSDREDYEYFLESMRTSTDIVERSYGVFISNFTIPGYNEMNLIVVNGGVSSLLNDTSSLVSHEKQHFINRRLVSDANRPMFDRVESDYLKARGVSGETLRKRLSESALMQHIKNEVLAFLRDGTGGREEVRWNEESVPVGIYNYLQGSCYAPLFGMLPKALRVKTDEALREIAVEMNLLKGFTTLPERAVLANHLISVPLVDMAEEISRFAKFYTKRLRRCNVIRSSVREYGPKFKDPDLEKEAFKTARAFESHIVDPRNVEDIRDQVEGVFKKYGVAFKVRQPLDFST